MGNYNPHAPQILGQEWVPIRDEDLFLTPASNTVEVGHGFTLATARTLDNGRFYIHELPSSDAVGQVFQIAVYAAGTEDQSGPIRSVIIPVNNGGVTGNALISGAVNLADALSDPSDDRNLTLSGGAPADANADLYFAVNQYAQLLNGKRILGVNLLYSATSADLTAFDGRISVMPTLSTDGILYAATGDGSIVAPVQGPGRPVISRVSFGEVSPFFSTTPSNTVERLPWIYTTLQRFEFSNASPITVRLAGVGNPSGTALFYKYAAMEVVYCEEKRLAVSGVAFGPPTANSFFGLRRRYTPGTNIVTMRTMSLALNPVLAFGDYTVVLSSPGTGIPSVENTPYPELNAVRELYQIPPHPGVQINIPFPVEEHIGDTLTQTVTSVLPQVSLHDSGGTLTEPHVYGRQGAAQVYGANTATQELFDEVVGAATTYPQVRFYARRFGDTTIPLTLTGTASLAASSAAISVADFDELTEIVDGWKEVTLRFTVPPAMGTLASPEPSWTWSATSETAGNRWEIMAACAPALSGTPGNLFNLVPAANQLYSATYEPSGGAAAELTWMPQGVGSPYVSGASADDSCDAMLIFSQDPPTITGVSISQLTQTVTGIGFDCGSLPCCIPSGIGYNQINWTLPYSFNDGGLLLPGTAGNYASTPDTAVLDITGDIDIRVDLTAEILTNPTTNHVIIAKYKFDTADRSWRLLTNPSFVGKLRLNWSNNGTTVLAASPTVPPVPSPDGRLAVRVTLDVDDGGGNNVTTFYTAPTIDGPWVQLGTPIVQAGVTSIFSGAADVTVGTNHNGTSDMWPGTVHAVEIRNGIGGTVVANPLFSAQPAGTTSFVDGAGRTWTVNGTASITAPILSSLVGGLELQRWDTTPAASFETIMLATNFTQTFNDYEARVGLNSVYRLRVLNLYNFAGAWSAQVTGAPPTPGVTGGCPDQTGALIFTSNADQTGGSNAAYIMQWESTPSEDFVLPEAEMVALQAMYGRDGAVAFHGTERGLERFSRTLLIQAAAIDPIRLADVKTLRDLAWADLPYVCVRDDIGDRWFANVRVPTVNARQNRTNYMARVDITELTQTPAQVDP